MDTRANYAIIGLFTLAVIAAAFGFVYWFAGTESGTKRAAYKIEFMGSVAGLNKGAAVLFNGIRVGDVTEVYFDKGDPQKAYAKAEVQPDTPIKVDTKARLDVAILSGAAVIALAGGSADAEPLEKEPGQDLPTIVAERGGLSSLLETARGTADQANKLLTTINELVQRSSGRVEATIQNLEAFSGALASNAPKLETFLGSVADAAQNLGPLSQKLATLADDATNIVRSVEPDRIRNIVRNVEGVTQVIEDGREKVASFISDASGVAARLNEAAPKVDTFLTAAAEAAQNIAPVAKQLGPLATKLATLADDTTSLVRAVEPERVQTIVRNVQGVTQSLEDSRDKVTSFISDASGLAARLNEAAPKVDTFLTAAADAAQSFAPVAKQLAPLAKKLETLTDDTTSLVRAVEPERVQTIVRNVQGVTQVFDDSRDKVATFISDASGLAGRLNESAPKLDQALTEMNRALSAIDPVKLNQVVDNAQRFTSGLSASTEDLQGTLRNSNSLTAKLNASADRVDGVLKAAENFLGSAAGQEGQSTFASIRTAMDAFRKASENLDRRATEIAQGVTRIAGVGSRQIEGLGSDARRAVNTVGRAARNLEKNPSSVIFGGGRPSIPEFSGR